MHVFTETSFILGYFTGKNEKSGSHSEAEGEALRYQVTTESRRLQCCSRVNFLHAKFHL